MPKLAFWPVGQMNPRVSELGLAKIDHDEGDGVKNTMHQYAEP